MNTTPRYAVPIGFATILGTVGAIAAVLIPLIADLADATDPLGVPSQTWAIISAVLAGLVVIGRMAQAAVIASQQPPIITEPVPEEGGAGEPGV